MIMEIVHEHLDFVVGVFGGSGLGGANFVEGGLNTWVDLGVEIEGVSNGLDATGAFRVRGRSSG